jgi:Arc/MetJ-type ribon-helix-helix transcriptional regulator
MKRGSGELGGAPMSFRLPAQLVERVDEVVTRYQRLGVSRAWVVRLALEEGLQTIDERIKRDLLSITADLEKELAARKRKGAAR